MNKKARNIIIFAVLAVFVTYVAVVIIGVGTFGKSPEIVNRDGIAYIQYLDKTCKLLDANGKQILYYENIEYEHNLCVSSSDVGDSTVILVYDESTDKYYISIKDRSSNDMAQALSIMYSAEVLEE